jgi:hypothetical protein
MYSLFMSGGRIAFVDKRIADRMVMSGSNLEFFYRWLLQQKVI